MTLNSKVHRFLSWLVIALLALALTSPALAQDGGQGSGQGGTPVTFWYFYDDRGQLVKVVDSVGNVVEYVYDPVGNILEVKRYTVAGLAVFNFTPVHGPMGTAVTVQGQQFSAVPAQNTVKFNGVAATVLTATSTSLLVAVPPGATTGPISVTVGGNTATSFNDFTMTLEPVITSISPPNMVFAGTLVTGTVVTGFNLTGATFAFVPEFTPPLIGISGVTIDPSGLTATMNLTVSTDALGSYVLVATNAEGSSDASPAPERTLKVLSNIPGEAVGVTFSILNTANPAPPNLPGEADGLAFSILNTANPAAPNLPGEADGLTFSILNTANPAAPNLPGEAVGLTFSILNQANPAAPNLPGEADGLVFSVENQAP